MPVGLDPESGAVDCQITPTVNDPCFIRDRCHRRKRRADTADAKVMQAIA